MTRPTGILKADGAAHALFGDAYNEIPKSVFAAIAWHLANCASWGIDNPGAAEARFLEEWRALAGGGHIPQRPPTARVIAKLRRAPVEDPDDPRQP